jgi:hypothetical protein
MLTKEHPNPVTKAAVLFFLLEDDNGSPSLFIIFPQAWLQVAFWVRLVSGVADWLRRLLQAHRQRQTAYRLFMWMRRFTGYHTPV